MCSTKNKPILKLVDCNQDKKVRHKESRVEVRKKSLEMGTIAQKCLLKSCNRVSKVDREKMSNSLRNILLRHGISLKQYDLKDFNGSYSKLKTDFYRATGKQNVIMASPVSWITFIKATVRAINNNKKEVVISEAEVFNELTVGTKYHPHNQELDDNNIAYSAIVKIADEINKSINLTSRFKESADERVKFFKNNLQIIGGDSKYLLPNPEMCSESLYGFFSGIRVFINKDEIINEKGRQVSLSDLSKDEVDCLLSMAGSKFLCDQISNSLDVLQSHVDYIFSEESSIRDDYDSDEIAAKLVEKNRLAFESLIVVCDHMDDIRIENLKFKKFNEYSELEWFRLIDVYLEIGIDFTNFMLQVKRYNSLLNSDEVFEVLFEEFYLEGSDFIYNFPHCFIAYCEASLSYRCLGGRLPSYDEYYSVYAKYGDNRKSIAELFNGTSSDESLSAQDFVGLSFIVLMPNLSMNVLEPYIYLDWDGPLLTRLTTSVIGDDGDDFRFLEPYSEGSVAMFRPLSKIIIDNFEEISENLNYTARNCLECDPYLKLKISDLERVRKILD